MREQLESKKHAESNFTTMLNEKEELLKILQLQVPFGTAAVVVVAVVMVTVVVVTVAMVTA